MRPIREIYYSSHFLRSLKRLPLSLIDEIAIRETIFKADCFDSRLKTHKLSGKFSTCLAFSLTHRHRVIFQFIADDQVRFIEVGDHSVYDDR